MEKQSSIEKEWIRSLESPDPGIALQAIYEIRNSGSVKMLPVLIGLIHKQTPAAIRAEILNLIAEIKSQDAVPLIASSLEKMDFGGDLPALVAACWQSGLDFSNHMPVFAKLFITGDYVTSLEAFTVLEEAFANAGDQARHECLKYLHQSEDLVSDDKLALFRELRKVIEERD